MAKARKKKKVSLVKIVTGSDMLPCSFVEVADPLSQKPGATIPVKRRLTPLLNLHETGTLDGAQLEAGLKFYRMHSQAELGGAKATDYSRVIVDSSGGSDPLSDQVQEALDWLRRVSRYNGVSERHFRVLVAVCGDEKPIYAYGRELSMRNGGGYNIAARNRATEREIVARLVEALDLLVEFSKIIAIGARSTIRAEKGDNMAQGGSEYEIDRFGDFVSVARA